MAGAVRGMSSGSLAATVALGVALGSCHGSNRHQSVVVPPPPDAAGAGGDAGGADGADGPPSQPPVSIQGRWGLVIFEDPVAVEIVQNGTELTGFACDAGFPEGGLPSARANDLCGPLTGRIDSAAAEFSFHFDVLGQTPNWGSTVTAARDGSRMTGTFSTSPPNPGFAVAWLPVPQGERWLIQTRLPVLLPMMGTYALNLVEASNDLGDFEPSRTYQLEYGNRAIRGDLGTFWLNEITVPQEREAVRVGPVAATEPALAVELEMTHDGQSLREVLASTGSGGRYRFQAVRTGF
jgi:hypothetical protein